MSEDCYIYWDNDDVKEAERKIYWQCVKCQENNHLGIAKWRAAWGYGNVTIRCKCGNLINENKASI